MRLDLYAVYSAGMGLTSPYRRRNRVNESEYLFYAWQIGLVDVSGAAPDSAEVRFGFNLRRNCYAPLLVAFRPDRRNHTPPLARCRHTDDTLYRRGFGLPLTNHASVTRFPDDVKENITETRNLNPRIASRPTTAPQARPPTERRERVSVAFQS